MLGALPTTPLLMLIPIGLTNAFVLRDMNPLKFHLIHHEQVYKDLGFEPNRKHIEEYLGGDRQDILDSVDIFMPNVRSINKRTNFDLFSKIESVTNPDTVIVIGLYLELLEYWKMRGMIKKICQYYCQRYPDNKVVVFWNSDIDAKDVFYFIEELPNLWVLNFNTSVEHERFILLSPVSIVEEAITSNKMWLANFLGKSNHKTRVNIKKAFKDDPWVFIGDSLPFDSYRHVMSQSYFTFCCRGVGLSSYRFYEAMFCDSIPVLFADDVVLPYTEKIDYNKLIIRFAESESSNATLITPILEACENMNHDYLNDVKHYFTLKGIQQYVYDRLQ
jgi:hypothetical protein